MKRITLQEAFNKIWTWFVIEKHEPSIRNGLCEYKFGKMRCALGILLPNKLYKSNMEGSSIDFILTYNPELRIHFPNVRMSVLQDLQNCHDLSADTECYQNRSSIFLEEITEQLKTFAKSHRLKIIANT